MIPSSSSHQPYGSRIGLPASLHRTNTDTNYLAPDDAMYATHSSSQRLRPVTNFPNLDGDGSSLDIPSFKGIGHQRQTRERHSVSRKRRKRVWKKLLWVKQKDYPDNYTDPPTFLSHLQLNPRLRPYDFWPLVADSTVIVQQLSVVAIFVCSFVAIYQQRVSPISVVSCGSFSTFIGWILWDIWMGIISRQKSGTDNLTTLHNSKQAPEAVSSTISHSSSDIKLASAIHREGDYQSIGLGLNMVADRSLPATSRNSWRSEHSLNHATTPQSANQQLNTISPGALFPAIYSTTRTQKRIATIKSAVLIYVALLGLSPILKSLTESTSSDSIWAISCWLMCINILFFDYSGGIGASKFPASLSTNAALMASTVLASRLPSTTHVFSLTLFSIEVFGLFPVFRRHLRHVSWQGHLALTIGLLIGAGACLGMTIAARPAKWASAATGALLWLMANAVGMGGCSWWLIGLQRYKNIVIGPWDPARPILRGTENWD